MNFKHIGWRGSLLLAILLILPPDRPVIKEMAESPAAPAADIAVAPTGGDDDFEYDEKLQSEADALLPLFDRMPRVPVRLVDQPILKSGTEVETGAAYTDCRPRAQPVIYVKKVFRQKANPRQLANTLKHELTHAWLCRQGLMSAGHGQLFRRKFAEAGGFGN